MRVEGYAEQRFQGEHGRGEEGVAGDCVVVDSSGEGGG